MKDSRPKKSIVTVPLKGPEHSNFEVEVFGQTTPPGPFRGALGIFLSIFIYILRSHSNFKTATINHLKHQLPGSGTPGS